MAKLALWRGKDLTTGPNKYYTVIGQHVPLVWVIIITVLILLL